MKFNVKRFVGKYTAGVLPYRDLPRPHQLAIAHYMSIDGDGWDFVNDNWRKHPYWKKDFHTNKDQENYDNYVFRTMKKNIGHFIQKYGKTMFGIGELPTDVAVSKIVFGWPSPKITTPEAYKVWVKANTGIPKHPKNNKWPVILDSYYDGNNLLQDGWHRFNCYLLRGDKTIPFVYYA